ncbi:MAG: DNA replication/repair protein RecF [Xanthomonadaceae bacterium]|nr:DNA replication/repair protein RecF [Xanthomonadaceae bacterium]MDE1964196.1 DNA replication/repair protein RecF [Xanthomonadaceae bacterium]
MRLTRLKVNSLRCLVDVSLDLAPGINAFVGANGAGKTSVLEAAFLLSHGRSFRSGARDALVRRGERALGIHAEVVRVDGRVDRLGLGKDGAHWQARVNFEASSVADLLGRCAVVSFDPGSHALVAGGAEERRRFLDWGVFHVEHGFLLLWRRYQRALKQRNSLLRQRVTDPALYEPWESELDDMAARIDALRRQYLDALAPRLASTAATLLPELGPIALRYRPGWSEQGTLGEQLAMQRSRDLARGHTSLGPHRADWQAGFEHAPQREHLSRGQEKLTALALLLAQADQYNRQHGEWPVVCVDDLASELDRSHQAALVRQLRDVGAQVLVTGTELPESLAGDVHLFHVEQGVMTPLL